MATTKKTRNNISPELQTYLDKIAAKYQPNQETLRLRIENAVARYSRTQQFSDNPTRLVSTLQNLILEGWRFCPTANASVLANAKMISVYLQKPDSMIEEELKALRSKVTSAYSDELFSAMEAEIDVLVKQAAEDARQKAQAEAVAEETAMRVQLRSLLAGVKA
jgi:hypothetical protein